MKANRASISAGAAALLPLSIAAPGPGASAVADAVEYLEPTVQRHVGVLPPNVCRRLIDLGEKAGFHEEYESIDSEEHIDLSIKKIPAQQIDVYDKEPGAEADIGNEAIWDVLEPWIPKITAIVKDNRDKEAFRNEYGDDPDGEPDLNWIFFRKYSPDDERNSLQVHQDTNRNTLNIELSDDYEGGGMLYIKPLASIGYITKDTYVGYEWTNSVKRKNTSDIVFPDLRMGDAVFYNNTVDHAVAPIESGKRYSMAFFFDIKSRDFDDEEGDDEESDIDTFKVYLHNELPDTNLDIVLRRSPNLERKRKREMEMVTRGLSPNNFAPIDGVSVGDKLWAVKAGTTDVIGGLDIESGKSLYRVALKRDLEPGVNTTGV